MVWTDSLPPNVQALVKVLTSWDWRIWLVAFIVGSVILQHKGPQSPLEQAAKVAKAAKRHLDAGDFKVAYMLLTRGLRLLGAFDGQAPSTSSLELRKRRAEILLQKGFNAGCVEECRFLRPPVSGALRARACAQMGSWKEARKALEEQGALQWACEHMGQSYPMLLDLGARQAEGGFDVLQLIGGASYMQHMKIPEDMGPVRFQSSKLQRKELPGRGKGIVAQADIGVGELLIAARPIELVRPGDGDWHFQADLEEVLTQRLLQRCMDCDAQCVEDVFSLFDGEGSERPKWNPHAWRSDDLALPMPIGAGNLELYRRLRGVVKHNAHRWPGKHPDSATVAPGLGLWLYPPMVNHAIESDGMPNAAHVFIGDVMLFRATAPIRAGEEVLDRYSTPLADQFEYTLHTLAAHGMRDPLYEAAAARWETPGSSSNKLSEKRAQLMDSLTKIQRKVTYSRNEFHSVVQPDYEELRDRYAAAKAEASEQELSLAPPEIRCLNLLCGLSFKFEGRCACLGFRVELVRRIKAARPLHFAEVKLWAELYERFEALKAAGTMSAKEQELFAEVETELRRCGEFWVGTKPADSDEWLSIFVEWARGGGYHFEWFSMVSPEEFLSWPSHL